MKLTVSRTMKRKGRFRELLFAEDPSTFFRKIRENVLFKRSAVYYLNVDHDVTREEMKLIKRKRTWEYQRLCGGHFYDRSWPNVNLGDIIGKRTRWGFESLNALENFERSLIAGLKELKQTFKKTADQERQQIEHAKNLKQQAVDFTSEGPHEVEL